MHNPPPPSPTLASSWRRCVVALAALSLLAGCSANGDFKEINPLWVHDDVHDWLDYDAVAGKNTSPSGFTLTDDERQLRDLAYPLIEQPYDRHQFYSVAGEYGILGSDHRRFDRTAYATHLFGSRYRSPSARYERLTDDIRNDATRLPQFFETAARVLDIDSKRRKSLAYVSALSTHERNEALRRIYTNTSLVSLVRTSLAHRIESYRFALERLVIMTPSADAVDVERSLNQLQAEIVQYQTHPAPTWVREQSLSAQRY